MTYDVIVVGGGPAGVTAALRTRELGASAALVERSRMGGTTTNDGCVPTRVLAKAARLLREAEQYEEYGLEGSRPQVNFQRLMARTQHIVYTMHEKKQLINRLQRSGTEVYAGVGEAHFVDPHTLALADGRTLQAERFILCAGGRSRRLDFPGAELAMTHSDIWSLKVLPSSIIIAGGAATGCQVGSVLASFGSQVTILELGPRLLSAEDEAISGVIRSSFESRGIQVTTGMSAIERLDKAEKGLNLTIKVGDEQRVLNAEAVMLSAGWLGNLTDLNLPAAGVESNGRYVTVDDTLRTTTPHIYAAGDITGRMMLVQSAGYEATMAAENAVLGGDRREKHLIVPHGGFTDPEYASVGLTEAKARQAEDCVTAVVNYDDLDRAVIDGHTEGLCKLVVSRDTHRIIGAHVVGEQALEIIHLVAGGMTADMWVEQLAELEIAYPTFTAAVGIAARRIVSDLGVRPVAREWREQQKPPEAEWEHGDQ